MHFRPRGDLRLSGTVEIPASKPHCQRALLLASLARGRSRVENFHSCSETSIIAASCVAFGARHDRIGDTVVIEGVDGRPQGPRQVLDTAGSGFALRTLLAMSSLVAGSTVFVGNSRLGSRPLRPLIDALADQGCVIQPLTDTEALPLVSFGAGLRGGVIRVPADQTSQFVTALLMVAPYADSPTTLILASRPVGAHYLRMTIELMRRFGAQVEADQQLTTVRVQPGGYHGCQVGVGVDVNAFFYFVAAAVVTEVDVRIRHAVLDADPFLDAAVAIGRRLGVRIEQDGADVRVRSATVPAEPVLIDATDVPTLVPALAAVAASLPAGLELTGAAHLVHHKTSRLDTVLAGLAELGIRLQPVHRDGVLDGFRSGRVGPPSGRTVHSQDDHRLFMALYIATLAIPEPVDVTGADTLVASFPSFVATFESLRSPARPVAVLG